MLKILSILLLILFNQSISYSSDIEVRGSGGKLKGNKSFERLNKITKFKSTHNKIKNKTILSANIKNEENFLRGLVIARKNVYKKASNSVVLIDNFRKEGTEFEWNGYGSGSLIKRKGKIYGILTNWHVIEGGDAFGVCFRPKRGEEVCKEIHQGHLVSFSKKKDLALLYIQADKKNHELIKLAKYDNAEIGDDAHAIGHPDGELWTFSTGMIGNIVKKKWKYDETFDHEANLLQIQTPINPGNSGGPLMNDDAELIGVNVMSSIKSENINFAIALDEVKKFINSSARKWNSIKEEIIKPVFIKDSKPVDDNNNGVADRYIVDENNDGNNDKIYIDENEDGNIDGLVTDDNNDGIWDRYVLDEDFNGEADTVALDENSDGKIDVIGKDFNEDGEIDKWENV